MEKKIKSTTIVKLKENHTLKACWYELANDVNNNGIADIGDEIKIGTESFYVISHTDEEINALAKYNLKVGNVYSADGTTLESTISTSEEDYGIQNLDMKGHIIGEKRYGTVIFSNQKGWPNENEDTIDIRNQSYGDGPVKDALYGENGYEKYLQKIISTSKVRLITKAELEALGCSSNNLSCSLAPSWVYSTSYWTQTAHINSSELVWYVHTNKDFSGMLRNRDIGFGVRPVITIPLT